MWNKIHLFDVKKIGRIENTLLWIETHSFHEIPLVCEFTHTWFSTMSLKWPNMCVYGMGTEQDSDPFREDDQFRKKNASLFFFKVFHQRLNLRVRCYASREKSVWHIHGNILAKRMHSFWDGLLFSNYFFKKVVDNFQLIECVSFV